MERVFPKRANKKRKISRREIERLLTPPGQGKTNSHRYENTSHKTDEYVGQPEYETIHDEKFYMNHLGHKGMEALAKILDSDARFLVGAPINPTPVYPTEQ